MPLFGGSSSSNEPLPVELLTLDYLIRGTLGPDAQKWAFAYFNPFSQRPSDALNVDVTSASSTGALPDPALAGARVSVSFATGLVALICREPPTVAKWEEWNNGFQDVPGRLLVGPYEVTGTVISQDGTLSQPAIAEVFPVRDATIKRLDGAGNGTPIDVPRAIFTGRYVQALATP